CTDLIGSFYSTSHDNPWLFWEICTRMSYFTYHLNRLFTTCFQVGLLGCSVVHCSSHFWIDRRCWLNRRTNDFTDGFFLLWYVVDHTLFLSYLFQSCWALFIRSPVFIATVDTFYCF